MDKADVVEDLMRNRPQAGSERKESTQAVWRNEGRSGGADDAGAYSEQHQPLQAEQAVNRLVRNEAAMITAYAGSRAEQVIRGRLRW